MPPKKRIRKSTTSPVPAKKVRLKAHKGYDQKMKPSRPRCPQHSRDMVFDAEVMVWHCIEQGCKMVAYPQVELGTRKPVIARGELEVIASEGGEPMFIRATDSNVFLDVTDYVESFNKVTDPDGTVHYTLDLTFDAAYKVGDDGSSVLL